MAMITRTIGDVGFHLVLPIFTKNYVHNKGNAEFGKSLFKNLFLVLEFIFRKGSKDRKI